jgi:hypothetical protein
MSLSACGPWVAVVGRKRPHLPDDLPPQPGHRRVLRTPAAERPSRIWAYFSRKLGPTPEASPSSDAAGAPDFAMAQAAAASRNDCGQTSSDRRACRARTTRQGPAAARPPLRKKFPPLTCHHSAFFISMKRSSLSFIPESATADGFLERVHDSLHLRCVQEGVGS